MGAVENLYTKKFNTIAAAAILCFFLNSSFQVNALPLTLDKAFKLSV
jgi:hypothetical protein